jgi:hypothetical protein
MKTKALLLACAAAVVPASAFADCHFERSKCFELAGAFESAWNLGASTAQHGPAPVHRAALRPAQAPVARPSGADAPRPKTMAPSGSPRPLWERFHQKGRLLDHLGGSSASPEAIRQRFREALKGTSYLTTPGSITITDIETVPDPQHPHAHGASGYAVAEWSGTVSGPGGGPHRVFATLFRSGDEWFFDDVVMIPSGAPTSASASAKAKAPSKKATPAKGAKPRPSPSSKAP